MIRSVRASPGHNSAISTRPTTLSSTPPGISAAHALANATLAGDDAKAVERYHTFLQAGGSDYPIPALQAAGVDMSTPTAVEETFNVLEGLVDRLEGLI